MEVLIMQPLPLSSAVPSLETIPGSRTETPARTPLSSVTPTPEAPTPTSSRSRLTYIPIPLHELPQEVVLDESPVAEPLMPGSYFSVPIPIRAHTPFPNSPVTTPGAERPQPPPLSIPPSTPDEPRFQAYPPKSPRVFHLKPSFTLRHPRHKGGSSSDEGSSPRNRRRSWTTSEPRPETYDATRRRRASLGSADIRIQPLTYSPTVTPRRSSLSQFSLSELAINVVLQPPPRSTSLVYEHDEPISIESIVSEISSPSMSSKHPLSSATTSISRSAKSCEDEAAPVSPRATRAQRRGMALLELVETEVSYLDDLQTLLHVYLPQLAAMPGVADQTRKLVTRNTGELCLLHTAIVADMVDVLRSEGVGYGTLSGQAVEQATQRIVNVLMGHTFDEYNSFTAESIKAEAAVSQIAQRHDYEAFERRCETVSRAQAHQTLLHLLTGAPVVSANRARLRFKDRLIHPYQRVCRYPMLLRRIMDSLPDEEHFDYNVDVDLDRAHKMMTAVADQVNRSRRDAEAEMTTAVVTSRLELHPFLPRSFLASLGCCQLVGALDVLHYHPTLAPNLKVKYLGTALFSDYLVMFKVKRGIIYEPRHFFPVSLFSIVPGGMLPHSIGLSYRDHHFELAASSAEEKSVWLQALAQSESVNPPYDRPSSVSTSTATDGQPRRQSAEISPISGPARDPFVRRASAAQRSAVDKGLEDITSVACAKARRPVPLFEPVTPARRHSFFDPHMSGVRSSNSLRLSMMSASSSSVAIGTSLARRDSSVRLGRRGMSGNASLSSMADNTSVSDFGTIQPSDSRGRRVRKTLSSFSLSARPTHPTRAKSMPVSPAVTPMGSPDLSTGVVASPETRAAGAEGEVDDLENEDDIEEADGETDAETDHEAPLFMTSYFDMPSRLSRVRRSLSLFRRNDGGIAAVLPTGDDGAGPSAGVGGGALALVVDDGGQAEVETETEGEGKSAPLSAASSQSHTPSHTPSTTPLPSPFVSPQGTPRRKRSVRLFGALRGFTPAHTVAG